MIYVEVERDKPYVEDLWYDFGDIIDAVNYITKTIKLSGVKRVNLWYDDTLIQSWED